MGLDGGWLENSIREPIIKCAWYVDITSGLERFNIYRRDPLEAKGLCKCTSVSG